VTAREYHYPVYALSPCKLPRLHYGVVIVAPSIRNEESKIILIHNWHHGAQAVRLGINLKYPFCSILPRRYLAGFLFQSAYKTKGRVGLSGQKSSLVTEWAFFA